MRLERSFLFLSLIILLISKGAFAADELEQKMERLPSDSRIEVVKASLSGPGSFLVIRFRIHASRSVNSLVSAREIYVIEESTGERFNVFRVYRAGALGQRRSSQGPILSVLIDNSQGKIKKDSRVTLMLGTLRQEHILVEEGISNPNRMKGIVK